jgi:hypothetical protein
MNEAQAGFLEAQNVMAEAARARRAYALKRWRELGSYAKVASELGVSRQRAAAMVQKAKKDARRG